MYTPEIIELIKSSRAMLDGKGWHEIDGDCSICLRFKDALEQVENRVNRECVCLKGLGYVSAVCVADCIEHRK